MEGDSSANRQPAEDDDASDDVEDSSWVLIPLAALMIPILGVSQGNDGGAAIAIAVAVALVLAVATLLARMLMVQRHNLRMTELRAERRLAQEESQQLMQANQMLERNRTIEELRLAVRDAEAQAQTDHGPEREQLR